MQSKHKKATLLFLFLFLIVFPSLKITNAQDSNYRTPKLRKAELSCHGFCACSPVPIYKETFFAETDQTDYPSLVSCPHFTQTDSQCKAGKSMTVVQCHLLPFGRKLGTPNGGLGGYFCVRQALCENDCRDVGLCGTELSSGSTIGLSSLRLGLGQAINAKRIFFRLKPLEVDPSLDQAAQTHAQDMFTNDYLSHLNNSKQDEFARAQRAGYRGSWVGDALLAVYPIGKPSDILEFGLISNPAHWGWILNPEVTRMGIGFMSPYVVVSFGIL